MIFYERLKTRPSLNVETFGAEQPDDAQITSVQLP